MRICLLRFQKLMWCAGILVFLNACIKEEQFKSREPVDVLPGWQIKKVDMPFPRSTNDLFFVDSQTGYIVANDGVLIRSTNCGRTWSQIAVDTKLNLNTVFFVNHAVGFLAGEARTDCTDVDCDQGALLLKTTDGGETWSKSFMADVWDILKMHFFDENNGLALLRLREPSGHQVIVLARTIDGGTSWDRFNLFIPQAAEVLQIVDNVVYAAGEGSVIYKSTDRGESWDTLEISITPESGLRAMYFCSDQFGFLNYGPTILQTRDGGKRWESVDLPFSELSLMHAPSESEVLKINERWAYIGGDFPDYFGSEIYYTDNQGESWNATVRTDEIYIRMMYFPNTHLGYGLGNQSFYTFSKL